MASWSPRSILIKTLAIQDPGTMVISGDYVWVKVDGLWEEVQSGQRDSASQLSERLLWFEEKWDQTYRLY